MLFPRILLLSTLLTMAAASMQSGHDQTISGSAQVRLSGSITPEQIAECKREARADFRLQLLQWLEREKGVRVDTTDLLSNMLFNNFIDSCLSHAMESPAFADQYWSFSYHVTSPELRSTFTSFNNRVELLAVHSWERLANAVSRKENDEIYYESIEAIAEGVQHLGPSLRVPGDSSKYIVVEARKTLRGFLGRLSVYQNGQLIEGKPGHGISEPPSLRVTIDGRPFPGFGMTGRTSTGLTVWNSSADSSGLVSFASFVMPFVKNGIELRVTPNLGRVLDPRWHLGIEDFGAGSAAGLNRAFFLKVKKPRFSLAFEAVRTGSGIALPGEFTSGNLIRSYLTDSCWLEPAAAAAPADLVVTIRCRIATTEAEALDGNEASFSGSVSIDAPQFSPPRREKDSVFFEKKYRKVPDYYLDKERAQSIDCVAFPIGDFVWESNNRLRATIRGLLERM